MQIEQEQMRQTIAFNIRGSLSGTEKSTIQLFEKVSLAIEKKPRNIVVDINQVTFIDSLSIGLLVGVLLKCQEHAIHFRLINVPDHVEQVLDSVNLKRIFPELY